MKITIARRIYLLLCLFATALVVPDALRLYEKRTSLLEERVRSLNIITDLMVQNIDRRRKQFLSGTMSEDETKRQALLITSARYGDGSYFSVDDKTKITIAHPDSRATGRNNSNIEERSEVLDRAIQAGTAQDEYQWPRLGGSAPETKISAYRFYKPWGWIISTGFYIDDINDMMWNAGKRFIAYFLTIMSILIGTGILLARSILLPMAALRFAAIRVASGQTETEIPGLTRQDEIGTMARVIEKMRNSEEERRRLGVERQAALQDKAQRTAHLDSSARVFDGRVSTLMTGLYSASAGMEKVARSMKSDCRFGQHKISRGRYSVRGHLAERSLCRRRGPTIGDPPLAN